VEEKGIVGCRDFKKRQITNVGKAVGYNERGVFSQLKGGRARGVVLSLRTLLSSARV